MAYLLQRLLTEAAARQPQRPAVASDGCLLTYQELDRLSNKMARALLRLGHAYALLKQWEPARHAYQTVIDRYGDNNTWAIDARYGTGWALQNQGRYDDAVNAYALVTRATTDDRAGRAVAQHRGGVKEQHISCAVEARARGGMRSGRRQNDAGGAHETGEGDEDRNGHAKRPARLFHRSILVFRHA